LEKKKGNKQNVWKPRKSTWHACVAGMA
jgi:hypothetical protein